MFKLNVTNVLTLIALSCVGMAARGNYIPLLKAHSFLEKLDASSTFKLAAGCVFFSCFMFACFLFVLSGGEGGSINA